MYGSTINETISKSVATKNKQLISQLILRGNELINFENYAKIVFKKYNLTLTYLKQQITTGQELTLFELLKLKFICASRRKVILHYTCVFLF